MKVRNPRTGMFDYEIFPLEPDELADKVAAMRDAQIDWKNKGLSYRIDSLKSWKTVLTEQKELLIETLTIDTGRKSETILEVEFLLNSIDHWCDLATVFFVKSEKEKSSVSTIDSESEKYSYGLIGIISPATFPLFYAIFDAIPALLSGCSVILKPDRLTPRFSEVLVNSLVELSQFESVFGFINGGLDVELELTKLCDKVHFTGDRNTAKEILKVANDNLLPIHLALGGKSVAIVSETADIERATSAILWGSAFNAGQLGNSIESIYVHRNIYHQFLSRLVGKANLLEYAYPTVENGQLGPVISEKQVEVINDLLQDAINKGAEIKAGARVCEKLGGGFYCRPTVLTNVTQEMNLLKQEYSAPLLPVITFFNLDDVIDLVNNIENKGIGAVFAGNDDEAIQIASQLNFSVVAINDVPLNSLLPEINSKRFNMFLKEKTFLINTQNKKSDWWY
jgi:succinate-semialdehyde dehydrogenase/glutarate-semialdehyde dehydrogenase